MLIVAVVWVVLLLSRVCGDVDARCVLVCLVLLVVMPSPHALRAGRGHGGDA